MLPKPLGQVASLKLHCSNFMGDFDFFYFFLNVAELFESVFVVLKGGVLFRECFNIVLDAIGPEPAEFFK
jgi:hypothetical protein